MKYIEDALFDDKYWVTKDGAILKIEDMDKKSSRKHYEIFRKK